MSLCVCVCSTITYLRSHHKVHAGLPSSFWWLHRRVLEPAKHDEGQAHIMTSSLGLIRYVSECQSGVWRDTHELSCFQAYHMWSYLDSVNVTRLLALSRYQMKTGHFFDKNLVLKDWKMRFEELSCFYMFTSKGLDWTSGTPLAEGSATRTFRVQNEDGLMSFHLPTTKAIAVLYKCLRPFEGFTTLKLIRHTDPTSQSTFWFLSNFWKTKYFAEHLLMPRSCSKLSVCQTIKLSSCRGHCLLRRTSFKRSASYLSLIKRYPKHI